ncbi:MAG: DNA repair protein RecO [Bacteroidales bacterium]
MSELRKVKGIFLYQIKYTEHSVIAKIYTDKLGIQSFIIRGVGNSKKNKKTGFLQPLTILNLDIYYNPKANIHHIKEMTLAYPQNLKQSDFIKSAITIFINELVYKSIKEQEKNHALFDFLANSIQYLEQAEENIANFHLSFAIQFSGYLGFFPDTTNSSGKGIFDLREGHFSYNEPLHNDFIKDETAFKFKELLNSNYHEASQLVLSRNQRNELLNYILTFYAFHLQGFGTMKSPHILQSILS